VTSAFGGQWFIISQNYSIFLYVPKILKYND
jgi:hypothetical protein